MNGTMSTFLNLKETERHKNLEMNKSYGNLKLVCGCDIT
jgi:hypothetical protein